jgi:hypothetical protein
LLAHGALHRPRSRTMTATSLCWFLVQRFARGMLQPLDFVLNHQFPALQFDNLQVIGCKVYESFV